MTMREKLAVVKEALQYQDEICKALLHIIQKTVDSEIYQIGAFGVSDDGSIEVNYGHGGYDIYEYSVTIPGEWLDEGFNYKAAYKEFKRKEKEKLRKEKAEAEAKEKEATEKAEYELYLKLQKKFERKQKHQ